MPATGHPFILALRRQRKVFLLFLLMVLAPAGVLSVFGLRAVEADRFRIERLVRREQEEAMRAFRRGLASQLESVRDALEAIAAKREVTEDWSALRRDLLPHVGSGRLAGSLITVTSEDRVLFVRESFLRWREEGSGTTDQDAELSEAERFEYSDPGEAVSRFARLARDEAPEISLVALNGLGRVHTRTGQYPRALSTYRELLRQWPELLSSRTAHLPLMAGLQIHFCLTVMEQPAAALPDLVAVYEGMVERRWVLDSRAVAFYASEYERLLDEACLSPPRQDACATYRRLKGARAGRLEEIRRLEAVAEETANRVSADEEGRTAGAPLWLPRSQTMVVAAPLPAKENGGGRERPLLAAALTRQTLLKTLGQLADGSGFRMRVVDASGGVLSGDPSERLSDVFLTEKLGLTDWTVTLFPASEYEHFATRTRNLYLALTGLLISVLALGAILIGRTVHHDMELIRLKSDFVSLVSHEFKTPIASMRALMERLQAGHVSGPERTQRYYDVISGELQRVTRLVNNVLDFSRIEEGRKEYSLQETDLPELVRELLSTFEAGASAKGFAIESDIPSELPRARVDPDAISQALLNLLDNAVKYSPAEKRIRVTLERNSHSLRIRVADSGEGIAPEESDAIFDKFYRGRGTRSQPVPGLGLGLSLVRHIMTGHGGDVTVESRPGFGSVFTLSLPLQEPVRRQS